MAIALLEGVEISIHALLWSATALARQLKSWETISIHALLWSATFPVCLLSSAIRYFYPRTPVECDDWSCDDVAAIPRFLSTHSCGVRR